MAGAPDRHCLARSRGLVSRSAVFRTAEGLEEQRVEGYDVSLRRVRFDEILLVTRHRTTNWVAAIAAFFGMGLVSMWSLMAGVIAEEVIVGAVAFMLTSVPLLVLLVLLLAVKVEVITVFGQRMRISLRFWLRKGRTSRVHDEICRAARQHQQRAGRTEMGGAPAGVPGGGSPTEPPAP